MTPAARNKAGLSLLVVAFAFLATAIIVALWSDNPKSMADPENTQQLARGKLVYVQQRCAACHGNNLEGQADWQKRLPSGRMPAPPHDASGHTWHHPDEVLFGIIKHGLVPGKYAPPGYQSDMPAYGNIMPDDDIWAVLAYIKSSWPQKIRAAQREMTLKSGSR